MYYVIKLLIWFELSLWVLNQYDFLPYSIQNIDLRLKKKKKTFENGVSVGIWRNFSSAKKLESLF